MIGNMRFECDLGDAARHSAPQAQRAASRVVSPT